MKRQLLEAPQGPILNIAKYGFIAYPGENFSDDGNYFRVYYWDPDKTGDKRFRATRLTANGETYFSVSYTNSKTHRSTYFDDLNGVSTQSAIDGMPALVDKLKKFRDHLEAEGEVVKELSKEEEDRVIEIALQLCDLNGDSAYQAFKKAAIKVGFEVDDLLPTDKKRIGDIIDSRARDQRGDSPEVVKILAKEYLQSVMNEMRDKSRYDSRGRYQHSPAKSLEDAMKSAYVYKQIGNKWYALRDLTDANQERIREWARKKIETLYDFD